VGKIFGIDILRKKVFSGANVVLKVMPRAIDEISPRIGPQPRAFERIPLMRAHPVKSEDLTGPICQEQRPSFDLEESGLAGWDVLYAADLAERHPYLKSAVMKRLT
jgi:hypothetical protein